jgi:hypothetical protein
MRVYHYLNVCWALENIRQRRLKLCKIDDTNDPYEWQCVRSCHPPTQGVLGSLKTKVGGAYGMLCFSRTSSNILMWSHYGDNHKGICLGFDVPDEWVRDVRYMSSVQEIASLIDSPEQDQERVIDQLSSVKYIGWAYEEEVRVHGLREVEEGGKYFTSFGDQLQLKEVITGARFSDLQSKALIEEALQGYSEQVSCIEARRSAERFEIIVDKRGLNTRARQQV